ncbi:MAG: FkbM family methyltransferase, partial [Candidatus Marsarchaeota archaeon]|nr:FkbM family methyltransferase [Candidatus Marsarchaeota archaeon]
MFKILLENLSARDKAKLIIGFPVIVVGTTLFSVTHYIKPLRKTMKDWWKVPFIAKGLIKKSTLTYTNGRQIKVDKNNLNRAIAISHFMALSNDTIKRCDIEASDDTVTATLMGRRFKLNLEYAAYIIGDISDREKLGYAKTVKGRKVLDIGAFVCDTTMFYAAAGAEHVYAFEPFTKLYLEGKRNISDNGFEKKVTLFNAGIAARPGSASLNESDEGGRRIDETENSGGMQIKLMTIEDMVNTYHINDGMMKIDI